MKAARARKGSRVPRAGTPAPRKPIQPPRVPELPALPELPATASPLERLQYEYLCESLQAMRENRKELRTLLRAKDHKIQLAAWTLLSETLRALLAPQRGPAGGPAGEGGGSVTINLGIPRPAIDVTEPANG